MNLLNYSLIKLFISLIIEKEMQNYFDETLKNSKSYKILEENYEIKVLEKIKFNHVSKLFTAYAYMHGFTKFK